MYVSIDRFEGNFAICECEDFKIIKILKNKLPSNVCEGDILNIDENVCVVDDAVTLNKKRETYKMQEDLFNRE